MITNLPPRIIVRVNGAPGIPGKDGTGGGDGGAGLPVLIGTANPNSPMVPAAGLGQYYRQGTSSPYIWWIWDGTAWVVQGSAQIPPYAPPGFTSFGITGYFHGMFLEVGSPFSGSKQFLWGTSNPANVAASGLKITYLNVPVDIATSLANDGEQTIPAADPWNAPFTTAGKHFRISGTSTQGAAIAADFSINGGYPWFYGRKVGGLRPASGYQALIDSGTRVPADSNGTLVANFGAGASPNDWLWFAVPATSAAKTLWWQSTLNTGPIGGPIGPQYNLFPDPVTTAIAKPEWAAVNYNVYVSNYQTAVTSMEFRNS